MDLKIKDVAQLLNVSETTIRRWLNEGIIPAYRIKHQYRFSRIEIENWVMSRKMNHSARKEKMVGLNTQEAEKLLANQMGTHAFSLYRAIHKGGVIENVEGDTKTEVIQNAVSIMANKLSLDVDVLTELLLDRESLMPTSLNHGVGVPHTRDFLLQKPYDVVTVVYPQKPIEYGALDGQKVHTMFFLFACEDKRHLHLLAKLAHLTRNEDSLQFLMKRPNQNSLLDYIKSWETQIRHTEEKTFSI